MAWTTTSPCFTAVTRSTCRADGLDDPPPDALGDPPPDALGEALCDGLDAPAEEDEPAELLVLLVWRHAAMVVIITNVSGGTAIKKGVRRQKGFGR